jgi:hypothetical protein
MWGYCHLKLIQVDLRNINQHRVIFSQCGGSSLRIYLSRPDEVYQRSQFGTYELFRVDEPLHQNNAMMLIEIKFQ